MHRQNNRQGMAQKKARGEEGLKTMIKTHAHNRGKSTLRNRAFDRHAFVCKEVFARAIFRVHCCMAGWLREQHDHNMVELLRRLYFVAAFLSECIYIFSIARLAIQTLF